MNGSSSAGRPGADPRPSSGAWDLAAVGAAPPSRAAELGGRIFLGDNLGWMRRWMDDPTIRGQVRLVYVDPPFSTGHSFADRSDPGVVAYHDTMRGTDFLGFLRERLGLLRDLLSEDGSIYVHIDQKVGHKVRVVMDEVFGERHFINQITRVKCNPKNFQRAAYGNISDVVLFYGKGRRRVWNDAREPRSTEAEVRLFPKVDAGGRRYTTTPLHAPGETRHGPTGEPWNGQAPPAGRHWRYPPSELSRLDAAGRIERSSRGNPRLMIYADEKAARGQKRQDLWVFKDPPYPRYPTEKNLEMLRMIIGASSDPGDLVVDAFCGSGTTLLAAHQMHRRFLGVDASATALRVASERLREAGARLRGPELPSTG